MRRSVAWVEVAILFLAAGLRFLGLGARSLWFDEALSAFIGRLDALSVAVKVPGSFHPPGYYLLLHLWQPLGKSAFALRFPSVFCSLLAVALTWRLARELFNRRTAWLAMLVMAVSPFQVYYAQEVRMYGPAIALSAGVVWAFSRAARRVDRVAWWIYGVLATLGLYVYYYVGLVLLGLHLWLLLGQGRLRRVLRPLVIADGLVAVAFVPQLLGFLAKSRAFLGGGRTTLVPNPLEPLRTLYYLLFIHVMPLWLVPVGLFVILALLAIGVLLMVRRRDRAVGLLLLVVLVPIVVVSVLSFLLTPLYIERSFAVVTPALVVLLACWAVTRRSPAPYLGGILVILLVLGVVFYHIRPDLARPPVQEALAVVAGQAQEADVILHLQDASYLPALYYDPVSAGALLDTGQQLWLGPEMYALFDGRITSADGLTKADRVWLTVMPGYVGPDQVEWLARWEADHTPSETWDWGAVQVRLYALEGGE